MSINICTTGGTAFGSVIAGTETGSVVNINNGNYSDTYGAFSIPYIQGETATFAYTGGVTWSTPAIVSSVVVFNIYYQTGAGRISTSACSYSVALSYNSTYNVINSGTVLSATHTISGSWSVVYGIMVIVSGSGVSIHPTNMGRVGHMINEEEVWGDFILVPTVISVTADEISPTTARIHGSVSSTGGSVVTTRGFDHGPTAGYGASYSTTGSFGIEAYDALLSTLPVNSPYHFRANAYNVAGWGYGSDIEFYTISGDEEIKRMSRLVYDDLMAYWNEEEE